MKSRLIRVIHENCSDCFSLTTSFLRKGVFLCHGNPINTTYHSTLVNLFPTITAAQLVSIIQNWVSTGPSLILESGLVRVNKNCPTTISAVLMMRSVRVESEMILNWVKESPTLSMSGRWKRRTPADADTDTGTRYRDDGEPKIIAEGRRSDSSHAMHQRQTESEPRKYAHAKFVGIKTFITRKIHKIVGVRERPNCCTCVNSVFNERMCLDVRL